MTGDYHREAHGARVMVGDGGGVGKERRRGSTHQVVAVMRRQTLKGTGIGALVGGVGGIMAGLVAGDDPDNWLIQLHAEDKAIALGFFFGITGAVVGGVAGALSKSEVWTPVASHPAPPVGVAVVPFAGDGGAGVRVGFSMALR